MEETDKLLNSIKEYEKEFVPIFENSDIFFHQDFSRNYSITLSDVSLNDIFDKKKNKYPNLNFGDYFEYRGALKGFHEQDLKEDFTICFIDNDCILAYSKDCMITNRDTLISFEEYRLMDVLENEQIPIPIKELAELFYKDKRLL